VLFRGNRTEPNWKSTRKPRKGADGHRRQHAQLWQYWNMAIWRSCNIDMPQNLNSHDNFRKRKFENQAPTSCRLGPVLSRSTMKFELHAEIAEEIELQKCNFRQLSQPEKPRDLDLGSGQGHININTTCSTTSMPNCVTVVSDSTEIWPCEVRIIWRYHEVWLHWQLS